MLQLPQIDVRNANFSDRDAVTRLYNHFVENTAITFDVEPFSVESRGPWFEQFKNHGPHQLFVAFDGEELSGYACSTIHRSKPAYQTSIETTVYVDPSAARHGVGRALYARLFAALSGQGIHKAFAGIAQPNAASEGFHKSFDFTEIGTFHEIGYKFGRFHDVKWFEKRL